MKPVAAKLQRQPKYRSNRPMNGTPMAVENFAAASVIEVAIPLSSRVNQYPKALAFAGKVGDSPNAKKEGPYKKQTNPGATAGRKGKTAPQKGPPPPPSPQPQAAR